jgi:hypothetical protein
LIGFTPPLRPVSSFFEFVSAPVGLLARALAPVLMGLRGHSGQHRRIFSSRQRVALDAACDDYGTIGLLQFGNF